MSRVNLNLRAILVLERDATAAFNLQTALERALVEVMLAFDVPKALERIERFDFSAAILDGAPDCLAVCKALLERGVPFLFYTESLGVIPEWRYAPVLVKPATAKRIVEAVAALAG